MQDPISNPGSQIQKNLQISARVLSLQTGLLATYYKQLSGIHQKLIQTAQETFHPQNTADLEFTDLGTPLREFLIDHVQRSIIFWDVLRQRGDDYRDYTAKGQPPVLAFAYKMLLDGRDFKRPVNYGLIEIEAPPGVHTDPNKRPFVIVDPRSGHGPGISGFKDDSQVGIALRAGHPVYFVIFFPEPEAQQTLFDIAAAEERFLRTVAERHPKSPKLCVIGNCQGGWAMLALAAAHPELAGAIIANGVPLSYWSGQNGKNPMRYLGGLLGGSWLVQHAGDLGKGKFDGAHLVMNFALINPVVSVWKKYYDLFSEIDQEKKRYLELERWLGGFTSMNTREMRTIADNLFIGNKLIRGKIPLNRKNNLDLRNIRTPLIIFCSEGDHVVPPQQALHWISDLYTDVLEIKLEGQVIVYLIHESVGHLGIFMSSKVAQKEHRHLIDFLNHIEHLPPGLYEMIIQEEKSNEGSSYYQMRLEERSINDIKEIHENHKLDHQLFDFVHGISNLNASVYDLFISPWIKTFVQKESADLLRHTHPLRMSRYWANKMNPLFWPIQLLAPFIQENRQVLKSNNPFKLAQDHYAQYLFQTLNLLNEGRDALIELLFHWVYGSMYEFVQHEPLNHLLVERDEEHEDDESTQGILSMISDGNTPEAVIRILLLLIKTQGFANMSHLSEGFRLLRKHNIFSSLNPSEFRQIVQNQTVIVEYDPDLALKTLPQLLKLKNDRVIALELIREIILSFETPLSDKIQSKSREIQAILNEQS